MQDDVISLSGALTHNTVHAVYRNTPVFTRPDYQIDLRGVEKVDSAAFALFVIWCVRVPVQSLISSTIQNQYPYNQTRCTKMVTPLDIQGWISAGLAGSRVEVDGDGQHFEAVVVCEDFAGKSLIQRHQMVYGALGDRMKSEIHALSMKTITPDEMQADQAKK